MLRYLQNNSQELELLFKELLIGVTSFFRDTTVWEQLKAQVIPELFGLYPNGKDLRAWVAACSTGEEAYSLAIVFKEALMQCGLEHRFSLQIFATDLSADAIDKARQGFYPKSIADTISPERLNRFLVAEDNGYRIHQDIRKMVIFAQQNIIMNPPFTKLDLLFCRNLLIYLEPECQKQLICLFHYALAQQGILLVGNAETIGNFTELFAEIDKNSRLYRRSEKPLSITTVPFPTHFLPIPAMSQPESTASTPILSLQNQFNQLMLNQFTPAAVLINTDGDILYVHGRTGKYLEPAAGKANLNIHAMAREGLRHELANAIKQAQLKPEPVIVPNLTVGTNGGRQMLNLTVLAIVKPDTLLGTLLVVFNELAMPKSRKRQKPGDNVELQSVTAELQQTREQLQTLHEEMQSSQEELKSSNEELQSTNEELQSSNEELVTSKEEMQSLNEELQTVNAELQTKVADLSWVNNDMKNLLNSMEIATIFLDDALHIRRFTNHASQLFKLIPGDIGPAFVGYRHSIGLSTIASGCSNGSANLGV